MTGCGARSTFLSVHQNLFWLLVRDGNSWFGHVTRHDSFSKTILQGTLEGEGRHGRQRKCWMDNVKGWTSLPMPELTHTSPAEKDWKRISAELSLRAHTCGLKIQQHHTIDAPGKRGVGRGSGQPFSLNGRVCLGH